MFIGFDIGVHRRHVSVGLWAVPTGPAPTPAPSFTVLPSVGGTATEGQTLTGSDGVIANGSVSGRAWLRSGTAIAGATGASYALTSADVGATIAYRVTAIGAGGSTVATSAATAPVAAAPTLSALTLAAASIIENSAGGTVVGGVLGKTSGSTLTLVDSAGSRFALSGTNIVAGSVATDYEVATSHSITVRETLAGYANSPRDTVLTITVTNAFEQPNLAALSLSSTSFTVGTAASGAITGATAGSTITASGLPTGLTINGAARTWAYDGTGSAGTSTLTLTEALVDSANSPRASGVPVTIAAAPTLVPADWRMPASVATSSGLTASQTTLAAAQSAASSKSRPSVTVASGATEYIEWTVQSAGTAILSWLGQSAGTASVAKNGTDQGFGVVAPSGSDIDGVSGTGGRRQFWSGTVAVGDVIRLTIAAGAAARTVYPLLHLKPASGPWDAHVVFGASREAYAFGSKLMEDDIIAADATRDPIIFNYAVVGQVVSFVATNGQTAAPIYAGVARHALLGNIIGNNVSGARPYTSGQKSALDASIATIATAMSGYTIGFANTSYRSYTSAPAVASGLGGVPTAPENGSAPYNDAVIGPSISTYAPACYDSSLQRARIDDYLAILYNRGSLTDEVHGAEAAERALWVATWFNYVRTGNWGTSQIEQRVAGAEASASTKATALTNYNEAVYAMAALAATSAKTALQARLDAIYPTVLFYEAVRLIDLAVASVTQAAKDTAQAALNAASTAGYSGGTSPNTIAAQQARIDAIVIASYDQIVQVGFGSTTAVTGWNRIAPAASTGVIATDLLTSAGGSTGIGLNVTDAGTGNSANTGLTSAVPEIPTTILAATWAETGNGITFEITGLTVGRLYTLWLMPSRSTGTASTTQFVVNGTSRGAAVTNNNNVTDYRVVTDVAPDAGGKITVRAQRGTGSFVYMTVLRLLRQA